MLRQSVLLSPHRIGPMLVPNRFIRSPICMGAADKNGFPTEPEFEHVRNLAKGKVGLIIPGYMYPLKSGRCFFGQTGIYSKKHIDVWKSTIDFCHKHGSKIVFQVADGGCACMKEAIDNQTPRGAYPFRPDTRQMTIAEIEELIESYRKIAIDLEKAGADGIMIHLAHGYALSQFLSPAINHRNDKYGGSFENRLRIAREITQTVRKAVGPGFAIISKLNGHDCIEGGVTPDLAAKHVYYLKQDGIQMFEVSCGFLNRMTMSRAYHMQHIPKHEKELTENDYQTMLNQSVTGFDYEEAYNLPYARIIKKTNPDVLLSVVGGMHNFENMESIVKNGESDFISIARPLVRDPFLVKKFAEGKIKETPCKHCNLCFFSGGHLCHCHYPDSSQ